MEIDDSDDSDQSVHTIEYDDESGAIFDYMDPLSCSSMIRAVILNDLDAIKLMVDVGTSINYNDNQGRTCLHVAVIEQNREIFDYLINLEDTRLDVTDFHNFTPLCFAIIGEDEYFASELIKRKADVNHGPIHRYGSYSGYPLHLAVACNKENIAGILIENGADINMTNDDLQTPLCLACFNNFTDCIHMFMYFGADPCIRDAEMNSPFCYLVMRQDIDILDTFMEYVGYFDLEDVNVAIFCNPVVAKTIIEQSSSLDYSEQTLSTFFHCFDNMSVDFLKLFMQKFSLIFGEISKTSHLLDILNENGGWETDQIIYLLFDNPYSHYLIENVDYSYQFMIIPKLCLRIQSANYEDPRKLALFEKMIYIALAEGIQVTAMDLYFVHRFFGYCELFKVMLLMDVEDVECVNIMNDRVTDQVKKSLLCKFIYDPKYDNRLLTIALKNGLWYQQFSIKEMLAFTASSALQNVCLKEGLIDSTVNLPDVPKLQEFARDSAREYLVKTLGITKCSQYHSMLKSLCIPDICKRILAFEAPLYY